jgi:hypothetical protein
MTTSTAGAVGVVRLADSTLWPGAVDQRNVQNWNEVPPVHLTDVLAPTRTESASSVTLPEVLTIQSTYSVVEFRSNR